MSRCSPRQRPAAPITPMHAVPLTAVPGVKRFPSFSPDGNHVTFTWTGPNQNNQDVYVQQIGAGDPLQLTTPEAADYAPVWSPDGRSIAFLRGTAEPRRQELRLIPPLGGSERKLTEIRPRGFLSAVTMAWCPDSSCLLVTDGQGGDKADALFVVSTRVRRKASTDDATGRRCSPTTIPPCHPTASGWCSGATSPRFRAASSGRPRERPDRPRRIARADASAAHRVRSEVDFERRDSVLCKGRALADAHAAGSAAGTAARRRRRADARRFAAASERRRRGWRTRAATRIPTSGASTPRRPARRRPRRPSSRSPRPAAIMLAHLSADGQRLTFISDRSGESEVWAADVSGANAVQLTTLGANPGFPRWSPDGQTIAFHSNAEDRPTGDVYLVSAEGGKVRNLTHARRPTTCSPRFRATGSGCISARSVPARHSSGKSRCPVARP